jgi:DNA-binding SARP family transcriptional activator
VNLTKLSSAQRNALLDSLVVAMYSDAHLARAEDARIERILGAMGFTAKFERDREFDAAVTRIRKYSDPVTANRETSQNLASSFTSRDECNSVINALTQLIGSDSRVTPEETRFLESVKATFMADRLDRSQQ